MLCSRGACYCLPLPARHKRLAEVCRAPPDPSAPAGCGLKMAVSASAALPSRQQHRRPQPPGELVTSSPTHFAASSPASDCTVGTDPEGTMVAAGTTLLGGYYGAGHHPPDNSLRGSIAHSSQKELMCQQQRVSSDSCAKTAKLVSSAGVSLLFPQWAAGPELGSPTPGLGERSGMPQVWARWLCLPLPPWHRHKILLL